MGGGFIGKLLLTILVIIVVWRGYRMLMDVQRRLHTAADTEAQRGRAATRATGRAAATLDLAPCPSCGTYIPRGGACTNESCRTRAV
jgi:hypothetical protein